MDKSRMVLDSSSLRSFALDDADDVWEELGRRVDSLVAAWDAFDSRMPGDSGDSPSEPKLTEHLPESPPAVRRLVLHELMKVDLEIRWERGMDSWRLEDYIAEIPEIAGPDALPVDLIYEEYHVRLQHDDHVLPDEYFARFPAQADELRRLLGLADPAATTTVCWPKATIDARPGQSLDDFDLLTLLGQGSFAKVFLARQRSLQRLVALKVSQDRGAEPQTLAQLEHPHVVRVFDQRQLTDLGLRLLYMEYVNGGTLQDVIARIRLGGPLPASGQYLLDSIDESLLKSGQTAPLAGGGREFLARATWEESVCRLGTQLATALDYAHSRGVLHRDVKPANVLLTADGQPKLADFNVSFCSGLDGVTPAACFGGSLAYMSPEQIEATNPHCPQRPEELDARADLFSLGILLWELLTGRRPFHDEVIPDDWPATLAALVEARRRGIEARELKAAPNSELVRVLRECLEPDPRKRPSSAAQLARDLHLCLNPRAVRLLRPNRGSWPSVCARFPAMSLILAGLVSHLVITVVNIHWNLEQVMADKGIELREFFQSRLLAAVNIVAYGVGLSVLIRIAWPAIRAVRAANSRKPLADSESRLGELRVLTVGDWIAWVGLSEWIVAGFAFPLCLRFVGGQSHEIGWYDVAHFVGSHTLGGMIAASMAFFLVNFLVSRALLPKLLARHTSIHHVDAAMRGLLGRVPRYVLMMILVPPVALMSIAAIPGKTSPYLMLGIAGVAGSLLAMFLSRAIQRDVAALLRAFRSSDLAPRGIIGEDETMTLV